MAALAKIQTELYLQDYLEQRTKQLCSWAAKGGISNLDPDVRKSANLDSVLARLAASRFFGAQEWRTLTGTCRAHCRTLAKFEALTPVFQLLLQGFAEMRGLSDGAASNLRYIDEWTDSVTARLRSVTRSDLLALKVEVQSALPCRPAACRIVLETASQILQPNEKSHDDFAVRRLGCDMRAIERALACGPLQAEQLHPVLRQNILKKIGLHSADIAAQANREDAAGAIAEWLLVMHEVLDQYPKIRGMYKAKEAVSSHIVPLAKWALRPHGRRRLFGRPPPPQPAELPRTEVPLAAPRSLSASTASSVQILRPGLEITAPASSKKPAAPARRCFQPQAPSPQNALPRSRGSSASGASAGVTPTCMLDGARVVPTVPSLGARHSHGARATQTAAPSNAYLDFVTAPPLAMLPTAEAAATNPPLAVGEAAAGTGQGASRAMHLWLQQFGRPEQQLSAQLAGEAPNDAGLLAASDKSKAWRGDAPSSCSTASTEDEWHPERGSRHYTLASWPSSSASSTVGDRVAPTVEKTVAPSLAAAASTVAEGCEYLWQPPRRESLEAAVSFAAATVTEGQCGLLELSDDESVFEID